MITFHPSRTGNLYAVHNNIRIHSPYDPKKEAERFIEHMLPQPADTVLLLGSGLGYLYAAIKKRLPTCKILTFFYDTDFYNHFQETEAISWHPNSEISLLTFLYHHLSDIDMISLKVIEWPPSGQASPEVSKRVNETIGQVIRELNGSIATTKAFGKRWIKNTVHNFLFADAFYSMRSRQQPLFIAASGPSLEQSFELLKNHRKSIQLWSLPSSLTALLSVGIIPDFILLTDPGYYSFLHVAEALRTIPIPTVMPLSANTFASRYNFPIIPLSQDYFFEREILESAEINSINVNPNGTVAGTALEVASLLGYSPIFFAGLDLCYEDLRTHVRPHAFDPWLHIRSNRIQPYVTTLFSRVIPASKRVGTAARSTTPLNTYAGWFSQHQNCKMCEVFRIFPSNQEIPRMQSLTIPQVERRIEGFYKRSSPSPRQPELLYKQSIVPYKKRYGCLTNVVSRWIKLLMKHRTTFRASNTLRDMIDDRLCYDILYFTNIAKLFELEKKLHHDHDCEAASILFDEMVDESISFLSELLMFRAEK